MSKGIGIGLVGLIANSTSESFRRQNAHLLAPRPDGPIEGTALEGPKKRLRQSSKPLLNELETRFLEKLRFELPDLEILSQSVRLELARGIWYKPDFFVPKDRHLFGGILSVFPTFYEVKGPKVFRGGLENLKVAARIHSWAKFVLVWEDDTTGAWQRQDVLA